MLKGLVACIILHAISFPALAGDRPGLAKANAAAPRDAPTPGRTDIQPFMLPAGAARLQPAPALTLLDARIAQTAGEPQALESGSTLPEITAHAGGTYAVSDALRDQRRPRHRGSPLNTALVLRLDGQDESPAFSIGGGGVAAAMWRAVPK